MAPGRIIQPVGPHFSPRAALWYPWCRTSLGSGCTLNATISKFCNTFLRVLLSTVKHSVMISIYFLCIVNTFLADVVFSVAVAFYVAARHGTCRAPKHHKRNTL